MHAIRSGDAIAAVYIPLDFERDLVSRKRPQIIVFYNRQFFTPGNSADEFSLQRHLRGHCDAFLEIRGAARRLSPPAASSSSNTSSPIPALNYAQFLLRAVLPTILHVVTAISAGYAVGSEFSSRSRAPGCATAGGSPLAALVGKLAPLFGIFVLMMVVGCRHRSRTLRRCRFGATPS